MLFREPTGAFSSSKTFDSVNAVRQRVDNFGMSFSQPLCTLLAVGPRINCVYRFLIVAIAGFSET